MLWITLKSFETIKDLKLAFRRKVGFITKFFKAILYNIVTILLISEITPFINASAYDNHSQKLTILDKKKSLCHHHHQSIKLYCLHLRPNKRQHSSMHLSALFSNTAKRNYQPVVTRNQPRKLTFSQETSTRQGDEPSSGALALDLVTLLFKWPPEKKKQ